MMWKGRVKDDRTLTVLGDNGRWEMKKFNASTIAGSIDVRAEEGSTQPKSKAYSQMMASQLMQAGLVDNSDPLTRYALLTTFDATDLGKGLDMDVKDAIKERETFLEHGVVRPREIIDNHEVHLAQHSRDAKTDAFFDEWPTEKQNGWIEHINWHFSIMMKRMEISRMQDPSYSRGQIANEMLSQRGQIENQSLMEKKTIDLKSKTAAADLKIHSGVSRQAASELQAELALHSAVAAVALKNNAAVSSGPS